MAQISKGDTFTDGQQVTGARLNQLVDSSVLLVGAVTEQGNLTPNTLEATDSTLVNDAGVLKQATIGDILNSNLPVTTSAITTGVITGKNGVNIVVTPAATYKFDVNGAFEAESINSVGNATIGGSLTVTGTSTHTGATTLTGGISGNTTINGNLIIGIGKTLTLDSAPTANLQAATKAYVDSGSKSTARAFVKFTGATGVITSSYNVASVTRISTGRYTVTFTTPFSTSEYLVFSNCTSNGWSDINSQTASNVEIGCYIAEGYGGGESYSDPVWVNVIVYQA